MPRVLGMAEHAQARAIRIPSRYDRGRSAGQYRALAQTVVRRTSAGGNHAGAGPQPPDALARVAPGSEQFPRPLGSAVTSRGLGRGRSSGSFLPIGRPVDSISLRPEIIGTLAGYLADLCEE